MKIDSHQHFWHYNPVLDDLWMINGYQILRRNFLPDDLEPNLKEHGFAGSIVVQHLNDEIVNHEYLALAASNPLIKGIVGWVDLCSDNIEARLEYYTQFKLIRGFRHLVHDEPNPEFMLQRNFLHGISLLEKYGFTYDFVVHPHQLPSAIEVAKKFPKQKFVLDHIAKPKIRSGIIEQSWLDNIQLLANASNNVYCKLSGIINEAVWENWSLEGIKPYLDCVIKNFGYDKIMFGSDWPVCLVAGNYTQVYQLIDEYFKSENGFIHDQVFGLNAIKFYNI